MMSHTFYLLADATFAYASGGSGPVYLDILACRGDEESLLDCVRSRIHGFVGPLCFSHRVVAGVICEGEEGVIRITPSMAVPVKRC